MKKLLLYIIAIASIIGCKTTKNGIRNMNTSQFEKYIQHGDVQLIDVRTLEEYSQGHIRGAINIDVLNDKFIENVKRDIDRTKSVAVYCRSGKRSEKACKILKSNGFKPINLIGGIIEWQNSGRPIE